MAGDLHCHTKISDGSVGIEDLVSLAKRRHLSAISVTDHDTTAGATRAIIIGKRQGVTVVHGIEFSTFDQTRKRPAHLLCYQCTAPDRLEGLCRRIGDSRRKAAMESVRRVMRYYPIVPEIIVKCATGSTNIYEQHIMHALMDCGYADAIYGEVYDKLFAPETGSAVVQPDLPDTREVLEQIHEAGGIAVLAHPYLYDSTYLMQELTGAGLDGIEVYHPDHTEQQTEQLRTYAQDNGLLMTGGSDFHGMYAKRPCPLGSFTVPDECVDALLNFKSSHKKV